MSRKGEREADLPQVRLSPELTLKLTSSTNQRKLEGNDERTAQSQKDRLVTD